ncbi:MAG: response regulator [Treponema sp.]|nr:response regulator [Treponema sp.]
MYSVFIVDDEQIVLDGIRNKIEWESSGFTFAGEASDGELAFSMVQDVKPDILITDIKMPFMDGLELSRLLKKNQPWIRIIILSGHDEFDFAKKAISIGVEDYILKPVTSDGLLASLRRVAAELDKERKQVSDISHLREELESNSVLVRNKFLTELVLGSTESSLVLQQAETLQLDMFARCYRVSVSEFHSKVYEQTVAPDLRSRVLRYTKEREDCLGFFISPLRFVCIVKSNDESDLETECYNLARAIEHDTVQHGNFAVVTAIGCQVGHLSELCNSYAEAGKVIDNARFGNKNRIVSAEDINKTSDGLLSLQEHDPIVDRLRYANKNEIDAIISQYLAVLKDNSTHFSIIASYLLVDVIMGISKLIEDLGGDIKNILPDVVNHSFVESAVQNEDVFIAKVGTMLAAALDFRDSRIQGRYGDVILKAKQFIEKNYADPNICLTSVAEAVHLSPNHFSTIFSQECGLTFIEYLTDVRIGHAKKLLHEGDLKSADIAYDCGFSDPHYFSFIFKKNTGLSPREYRNGQQNKA